MGLGNDVRPCFARKQVRFWVRFGTQYLSSGRFYQRHSLWSHASDIGHWLRMTPCGERFPHRLITVPEWHCCAACTLLNSQLLLLLPFTLKSMCTSGKDHSSVCPERKPAIPGQLTLSREEDIMWKEILEIQVGYYGI